MIIPRTTTEEVSTTLSLEVFDIMIWTQETQKQIILTNSCFFFPFWATESITWRGEDILNWKQKHSWTYWSRLITLSTPSWASVRVAAAEEEEEEEDEYKRVLWVIWPFWVSERKQIRPCSLSYIVLKIKLTFNARESTKKCLIEKTPVILAIVL